MTYIMMIVLLTASLAIGFSAGREFDTYRKRVADNRRRRREEAARIAAAKQAHIDAEWAKDRWDFMREVQFGGPR